MLLDIFLDVECPDDREMGRKLVAIRFLRDWVYLGCYSPNKRRMLRPKFKGARILPNVSLVRANPER